MENEIWRDIEDFEGLYQVSNLGRVRSVDRLKKGRKGIIYFSKGKIMSLVLNRYGYLNVQFSHNYKFKTYKVHRLVAKAFPEICGEWFEGCEVDHINTITDDNRVENLKVCTPKENSSNPLTKEHLCQRWEKQSFRDNFILKKSIPIVQLSTDGSFCKVYESTINAHRKTNICKTSIGKCCRGKQNTAGGYYWFFLEDDETKNLIYD